MRSVPMSQWLMAAAFAHDIQVARATYAASCFASSASLSEEATCDNSGTSQLQVNQAVSRFDLEVDFVSESNDTAEMNWDIIDSRGVKYTDVAQGELGTCYFLAALVSIAHSRPDIIEDMFVDRHLWNQPGKAPVYTTIWMINGESRKVAVSGNVPVNPRTGMPVFTRFNDGMDFWPVVLEKAWAKIFGAYKRISGGLMQEAFRAVTEAPVETLTHDKRDAASPDSIWAKLLEAKERKFPSGAGSRQNKVGIPPGHAYAIFDVKVMAPYGRVVHVYNPWAKDRYQGRIPNPNKSDGQFFITIDEYFESFDHTTVARVLEGYKVSSTEISKEKDTTVTVRQFTIQGNEPFSIEFEWPSERFVKGCKVLQPEYTLVVAKVDKTSGSYKDVAVAKKSAPQMNNAVANMKGGAGTYVAFLNSHFPHGPWLKDLVLSAFAKEQLNFQSVQSPPPMDIFVKMTGMCGDTLEVKGFGGFEKKDDQLAHGAPTFWRKREPMIILFWNPLRHEDLGNGRYMIKGDNTWKMTDNMEDAFKGRYYKTMFEPSMVKCSTEGALFQEKTEMVQKLLEADMEEETALIQDHLHTHPEKSTNDVALLGTDQGSTVTWSCNQLLDRLHHLNNVAEIQGGRDSLFPPAMSSIGGANEHCGDAAAGNGQSCNHYNTWASFDQIAKKLGQQAALKKRLERMMELCIQSRPDSDGKCLLKNRCNSKVKLVCDTEDGAHHITHHVMNVPPRARGRASSYYCGCKHLALLSTNSTIEEHISLVDW